MKRTLRLTVNNYFDAAMILEAVSFYLAKREKDFSTYAEKHELEGRAELGKTRRETVKRIRKCRERTEARLTRMLDKFIEKEPH